MIARTSPPYQWNCSAENGPKTWQFFLFGGRFVRGLSTLRMCLACLKLKIFQQDRDSLETNHVMAEEE